MQKSPASYIPTLDGWRALAVLLVIGGHSCRMLRASDTWVGTAAARFFEHGGYGVDIFFAISGFLISLLLREKATGSIHMLAFYRRRAFRILPPMLVYLAVVAGLGVVGALPVTALDVISALFFFRNYVDGSWYTGHFWSLAIEEHYYLLVPLVIGILTRRRAFYLLLAAALACIVIRGMESVLLESSKVDFRTEARFDALMWGSILAVVVSSERLRAWLTDRLTWKFIACMLLVAVAGVLLVHAMPVRRTIVAFAVPLVLLHTILRPHELPGKLLELHWMRWIGRLSYSLYIWQMMFLTMKVDLPLVQTFPGAFIATIACALVSYHLVEKPAVAWARRARPAVAPSDGANLVPL